MHAPVWPSPEVVASIRAALGGASSDLALVLGSGLGGIANRLEPRFERSALEIPGYPQSTVPGHAGRLLFGRFAGRDLWIVQGRVHLYEGYAAEEATRYVRLLQALGVRTLVLTNAAGSVDAGVAAPGDVLLGRDAISLFLRPLAAPSGTGPWRSRRPLVDPDLCRLARAVALDEKIVLREGVLVGSLGPTYETAAEVRAWKAVGGTVASMSTVPEALVAREAGMRCLLFSLVTNLGTGLSPTPLHHDEVVAMADQAGTVLERLLAALLPRI